MHILIKNGLRITKFSSIVKAALNSYYSEDTWDGKKMIDVLIDHKVNINMTNANNRTILWIFANNMQIVEFLKKKGVNTDVKDIYGETIYDFIKKNNNNNINRESQYYN